MLRMIFIALAAMTAYAQSALADNFDAEIKQATELSKAGKPAEALKAMDRATTALWLRSPLSISKAFFVSEPAQSYGVYKKRPTSIYSKDSKLRIYTEVIGYGWENMANSYKINLVVDANLLDANGKSLWSKKAFGHFRHAKFEQFKNLYVNLSLNIAGISEGKYTIEYTIIDRIRKQIALISLPFTVQ